MGRGNPVKRLWPANRLRWRGNANFIRTPTVSIGEGQKKAGDCTLARGSRFQDQDPIALTRFVGS
jgi:hypothetical protein